MLSVARGVFSPNAGRWAIDRARGRFFSRAFRVVDPKVEDFFAHKDNHSVYLCAFRTKKARRSLHISAIRWRFFLFIVRIVCKTRHLGLSSRGQRRESLANMGATPRSAATARGLHPRTSGGECLRFRGHRALFLHGEQGKELSLPPSMGRTDSRKRPNRRRTHRVSVGGLAVNG